MEVFLTKRLSSTDTMREAFNHDADGVRRVPTEHARRMVSV